MHQVRSMWEAVAAANPGRRMLLIFHQRRLWEIEQYHPGYVPWINSLKRDRALFATPAGSNDDWYWLYASVKAQVRVWVWVCLCVCGCVGGVGARECGWVGARVGAGWGESVVGGKACC